MFYLLKWDYNSETLVRFSAAAFLVSSASGDLGASLHLGHDHFGGLMDRRSLKN